jgi:hypothetical protein
VDQLLPGASADLRATVLGRAGDSPLFIEQCVQLLTENGAVVRTEDGVRLQSPERLGDVPRSMQSFVSERLDLLSPEELEALGTAAALGPQPELSLLVHLVGRNSPAVDALVQRGLLRRGRDTNGDALVRFSHALVRDAALDRVPVARRVQVHRAAAEWYAVLPVSQVLEAQAFHLESAVRLEEPDCEALQRAVAAMVLYARSVEEERTQTAHQVLVRAQELAASRPDCGCDLLDLDLAQASVAIITGREADAAQAAARALAVAEERGRAGPRRRGGTRRDQGRRGGQPPARSGHPDIRARTGAAPPRPCRRGVPRGR